MKKILFGLAVLFLLASCGKENAVTNINVQGYWLVLKDTTFTSNSANANADLYHLFKGDIAFYRFSFLKTHDFTVLTSSPRADSLIASYQVRGDELWLPNPAPSFNNIVPANKLISRTDNEMIFTRYIILRRSTIDGKVLSDRTDTIKYVKVTDPAKVNYFDNYLKRWHP